MRNTDTRQQKQWVLVFLAWLIALAATLGALFLGEVMGRTPCLLCWYQRIAMFPLVVVLGVGLLPFDPRGARYALPLALVGGMIALYHCVVADRKKGARKMNRSLIVLSAALLALVVFVIGAIVYHRQSQQEMVQSAEGHRAALIRPYSPVYGNPNAKVTIVEFLDPACEACSAFYPLVKGIVNASFGRVNLVLRYAAFHKGSDEAVKIAEAARMQPDVYWPVLEAMLKSQSQRDAEATHRRNGRRCREGEG